MKWRTNTHRAYIEILPSIGWWRDLRILTFGWLLWEITFDFSRS